ncbi:MAG TPA: hypothetical protein VGN20_02380 [Mucilaginibacter sp.]|jgi:hypothetical protein
MKTLPQYLIDKFLDTLSGDISINEFEQWIYNDKKIANILSLEDYLDLISLNYQKSGAKYELDILLKKHVGASCYETHKMLKLLYEAELKTHKLPDILRDFYDLYCKEYNFLMDLGIGYGLKVEVPPNGDTNTGTWEDLSPSQQKELLDSFSPGLEKEINQVINWLIAGKIVLTGEHDEMEHWRYNDFRSEEEKKSKIWRAMD